MGLGDAERSGISPRTMGWILAGESLPALQAEPSLQCCTMMALSMTAKGMNSY